VRELTVGAWIIAGVLIAGQTGSGRAMQPADSAADSLRIDKGLFLIAEPHLRDPNFSQTVVLIIDHGARGTTGVIVNRPTTTLLSEVLSEPEELAGRSETLYVGGPVEPGLLLLLVRAHQPPEHAERVFDDVYVSRSTQALTDALKSDGPKTAIRMFAGYAGWAPGQLADEIRAGGWRVVPADAAVVFDRDTEVIWKEMIRRTSEQFI
jgi:putative transcriptional regulator